MEFRDCICVTPPSPSPPTPKSFFQTTQYCSPDLLSSIYSCDVFFYSHGTLSRVFAMTSDLAPPDANPDANPAPEATPDLEPERTNTVSPPNPTHTGNLALDEESALKDLTENVRDQDELERDITFQANLALISAEDKKDEKRIEKVELAKTRLENQKRVLHQKLRGSFSNPTAKQRIQQEIARADAELQICDQDISDFKARIEQRHQQDASEEFGTGTGGRKLPNESQREYLIRTGKITPFAKVGGPRPEGLEGDLADVIIHAEDEAVADELEEAVGYEPRSHQNLRLPGFAEGAEPASEPAPGTVASEFSLRPRKKRKVQAETASSDEFTPSSAVSEAATPEPVAFGDEESDDVDLTDLTLRTPRKKARREEGKVDLSQIDDGNEAVYQRRLDDWVERRSRARERRQERSGQPVEPDTSDEEWFKSSPDQSDHQFENGLKLPGDIYPSLFDYQKTGVQWLAELYAQKVGGIIGDEMGLGKTGMGCSLSLFSTYTETN